MFLLLISGYVKSLRTKMVQMSCVTGEADVRYDRGMIVVYMRVKFKHKKSPCVRSNTRANQVILLWLWLWLWLWLLDSLIASGNRQDDLCGGCLIDLWFIGMVVKL